MPKVSYSKKELEVISKALDFFTVKYNELSKIEMNAIRTALRKTKAEI